MASLMESKFTPEQHAMIKKVLMAQTDSIGSAEIPIVADLLKKLKCRTALDIGCGEGSFLLQLAGKVRRTRFVGIDHSELSVRDALANLRRRSLHNVRFETAFFDQSFERRKYDAIMTRYTLQHSSDPQSFLNAVFERLRKNGTFVALESLDDYMDSHEPDDVWERFRTSVAAIHRKAGSDNNIGKSLGLLMKNAGFREIQIRIVMCSPSTVGMERFQVVVRATADLAFAFFPDLFNEKLHTDIGRWIADSDSLGRKDPYICSAAANALRP
jgi:ubiquinone/menaquinone biosynthesis C-methylase UbiE